jgi:hypothetical protein
MPFFFPQSCRAPWSVHGRMFAKSPLCAVWSGLHKAVTATEGLHFAEDLALQRSEFKSCKGKAPVAIS